MSGTWGSPNLPSGIDQFTRKQEPDPAPVDDLSRFVLERIREAETEPRADGIPQNYTQPGMPIVHRYAGHVRADMAAFRRIVKRYVEAKTEWEDHLDQAGRHDRGLFSAGLAEAVREIACRWSWHPDFDERWRLE